MPSPPSSSSMRVPGVPDMHETGATLTRSSDADKSARYNRPHTTKGTFNPTSYRSSPDRLHHSEGDLRERCSVFNEQINSPLSQGGTP